MHLVIATSLGHTDCERIAAAALAQPVLAVSSLAYLGVGTVVLWWAMRTSAVLAAVAGAVLVAVGVGSFVYHGPQPSWAQLAHDLPIVAIGAVCAVGLVQGLRRRRWSMWAWAAVVFAVALASYAAGRSGSPLCRPDSLWQYHGAWHVLSGLAIGVAAWAMASRASVKTNLPRDDSDVPGQ